MRYNKWELIALKWWNPRWVARILAGPLDDRDEVVLDESGEIRILVFH